MAWAIYSPAASPSATTALKQHRLTVCRGAAGPPGGNEVTIGQRPARRPGGVGRVVGYDAPACIPHAKRPTRRTYRAGVAGLPGGHGARAQHPSGGGVRAGRARARQASESRVDPYGRRSVAALPSTCRSFVPPTAVTSAYPRSCRRTSLVAVGTGEPSGFRRFRRPRGRPAREGRTPGCRTGREHLSRLWSAGRRETPGGDPGPGRLRQRRADMGPPPRGGDRLRRPVVAADRSTPGPGQPGVHESGWIPGEVILVLNPVVPPQCVTDRPLP